MRFSMQNCGIKNPLAIEIHKELKVLYTELWALKTFQSWKSQRMEGSVYKTMDIKQFQQLKITKKQKVLYAKLGIKNLLVLETTKNGPQGCCPRNCWKRKPRHL